MFWKTARDYLGVAVGTFLLAYALMAFLVPNKIAAGGLSGIATVLYYLFNFPVGVTMLVLNIPLFALGIKEIGLDFGVRSLFGAIALSFFTDIMEGWVRPLTAEPLLAAIYGGILSGIGLGIVFRFRGSTGGTALAARLLHKYLKFSIGISLLVIDFLVISWAGIVFNLELAMYALISLFVTTKVIDLFQEGLSISKAAYIISKEVDKICDGILHDLDRGATIITGRGSYTGQERNIVLCVVDRSQISRLKELVYQIDPKAFVIIHDTHEVLGEGFKEVYHQ